jgi:DNA-binding transcriptional regulator LsrR (DeoR family)
MARRRAERLDDAARAGWLYYVAGRTQDDIAAELGVSRQSAQRLVALSVSEHLIRFRLDHPIGRCLDLAKALCDRHGLARAEVVPRNPGEDGGSTGLAQAGATEIERWLRRTEPTVLAVGTGRTLKATIDQLTPMACPQHKVVSLTGNIGPDGSAAYYNVIFSMAEVIEARHFPMPLPVFAASRQERELLHAQTLVRSTVALAAAADAVFVGVGEMDETAPLFVDGFLTRAELSDLRAQGAVGEICGWIFDADGRLLDGPLRERNASAPIPDTSRATVTALAKGSKKLAAIRGALAGRIVNALVTDETTAEALLAD